MDKGALLDRLGAQGEERLLLGHVLDWAEQARRRNGPTETDFLSPAEQVRCGEALRFAGFSETDWAADGGYDGKFVVLYYDRASGERAMINTEIPVSVTVTE